MKKYIILLFICISTLELMGQANDSNNQKLLLRVRFNRTLGDHYILQYQDTVSAYKAYTKSLTLLNQVDKSDSDFRKQLLENLFVSASTIKDIENAILYANQCADLTERMYGRYSPEYKQIADDIREINLFNTSKTYYDIKQRETALLTVDTQSSIEKSIELLNNSLDYLKNDKFKESIELATAVKHIYDSLKFTNNTYYATALLYLGDGHFNEGDYNSAEKYLKEAHNLFCNLEGANSEDAFSCNSTLVSVYQELGDIPNTMKCAEENLRLSRFLYGGTSTEYAAGMLQMGMIKQSMMDYSAARYYCQKAAQLYKYLEAEEQYIATIEQGVAEFSLGHFEDALTCFDEVPSDKTNIAIVLFLPGIQAFSATMLVFKDPQKAESIIKKIENQQYDFGNTRLSEMGQALYFGGLASYYLAKEDYSKARERLSQSLEVTEHVYGKSSYHYADILKLIGLSFIASENYNNAIQYLEEAEGIIRNKYGVSFPQYTTYLESLYGAKLMSGRTTSQDIQMLLSSSKTFYEETILFLTSEERLSIVEQQKNIKSILANICIKSEDYLSLFDYTLLYKEALLSKSIELDNIIKESGDDTLKEKYRILKELKQSSNNSSPIKNQYDINSMLSTIGEYLNNNDVTLDVSSEIQLLEREILDSLKNNASADISKLKYEDIQSCLHNKDIAIEFIEVAPYNDKSDSTYYALIGRKDWSTPKCIKLISKKELENITHAGMRMYTANDKIAKVAYEKLWAPILIYTDDLSEIYFSSDGFLHQIALENIPRPNGVALSDIYHIHRVSSTRAIKDIEANRDISSACLYGGLTYDVDSTEFYNASKKYTISSSKFRSCANKKMHWEYLPNSLDEVKSVERIIRKNVTCSIYSKTEGNEESFKAMSGNSPSIIHIASHGFYNIPVNDNINSSPMQNAGIILSGGNNKVETAKQIAEDGILTAAEIAELDFSNTELAVLSTCDSGLGMTSFDGVFGLQRGFKSAGVHTIIMTLWKVDDTVAKYLMISFYTNLSQGHTIHESFNLAKTATKIKYPDPFYWASFIMLD